MIIARFLSLKALLVSVMLFCSIAVMADESVEIVILATADIHGRIAQLEHAVAPAVKREAARLPGQVFYVDVGDIVQGSFEVDHQQGSGVLRKLGDAGCCLFVPGNHELEYGFEVFKKLLDEFPGTVLAANLRSAELQKKVLPYKVFEVKGVKIAFIGLMLKKMNNCFPVAETRFQTLPGRAVLRRCIDQLRKEGAEIIVLLRHAGSYGGGENLLAMVKDMPEVDLVIGAHTHRAQAGLKMGNIWYVQPAPYAESLLKTTLFYDRKQRRLRQIESEFMELVKVEEDLPQEAFLPVPAAGEDMDFPAQRIRKYTGSDLAVYAVSSVRELERLILTEKPRLIDYYRAFPHADKIVTVKLSAAELRSIVKEYAAFAYKRKQFLTTDGFTLELSRGKLKNLAFDQEKSHYKLALPAYIAAGAGGQLPGVRRILKNRIDHQQAERACSILNIITQKGEDL